MKLAAPLLALFLVVPHAPDPAPEAEVSLRLPDTAQDLEVAWRQLGTELSAWLEPQGATPQDLHRLRVQSILAFGGSIRSDVDLRAGGHRFREGKHPFGFTLDQGGALRFFMVDGTEAIPLPSDGLDAAWLAPHMVLSLAYVKKDEVRLLWHVGEKAGSITFRLGLTPR